MAKKKHSEKFKNKVRCILLVDDDPICNYLHLQLLNNCKVSERIDIVTNGEEALIYFKELCHPDILFLDINMPIMDRIEFLRNIHQLNLHLKPGLLSYQPHKMPLILKKLKNSVLMII